jgi:hypothetical protein
LASMQIDLWLTADAVGYWQKSRWLAQPERVH